MGHREQCVGATDEWFTPPHVFEAMGVAFDMDVASPGADVTHWIPARTVLTKASGVQSWEGFIWMNPPFGGRNGLVPWLDRFCAHGNGVCLVPDRTSAPWWQTFVRRVDVTLFVAPRIKFISPSLRDRSIPAQGTCLWSIGERGAMALRNAHAAGLGTLMRVARD